MLPKGVECTIWTFCINLALFPLVCEMQLQNVCVIQSAIFRQTCMNIRQSYAQLSK